MSKWTPYAVVTTKGNAVKTDVLENYTTSQSKQLQKELFTESQYTKDNLVKPLYEPLTMAKLMEINTYHMRACRTKAEDVAGNGWRLTPTVENPDESQKEKIESFINHQPIPIEETLKKLQLDKESVGYFAMEIARAFNRFDGEVDLISHIPAHTIRIHNSGNKYCQSRNNNKVWFRDFGYEKDIDCETGREAEEKLTTDKRANEVIWNTNYTPRSCFYGVPDVTSAIGAITGDISRRDYNISFFCLSEDTEILTRGGWKYRNQLVENDEYATFNLDTEAIEYQKATHITDHKFDTMISVKSGITDLLVSGDHTLIYKPPTSKTGKWLKGKFRDLIEGYPQRIIPVAGMLEGEDVGINENEAALLGWIITEGSFQTAGINSKSRTFTIGQNEGEKADRIRELLKANNIIYGESKGISASGKDIVCFYARVGKESIPNRDVINGRWIAGKTDNIRILEDKYITSRKHIDKLLDILEKGKEYIPDCIQLAPINIREAFFEAMIAGDGYIMKGGGESFVAKNKKLIDQMQQLAVGLGYRARITSAPGECWVLYCYKRNYAYLAGAEIKEIPYGKNAWCPTVKNGTIVVRRNGKVSVVGNSNFGVPAYLVSISGDFDPGEIDPKTGKTPMVENIEKKFKELVNNPQSVLILTIPKTETGQGNIEIKIEPLSTEVKEASFRLYRNDNRDEVIAAHGMPPYRMGIYETGSLAGNLGRESTVIYYSSIIQPRQNVFNHIFNQQILPTLGITDYYFELESIDLTEIDKDVERCVKLLSVGVMTPNDVIEYLGDYFGLEKDDDNLAMTFHYINGQPIDAGGLIPQSELTSVMNGVKDKLIEGLINYVSKNNDGNLNRDRRITKAISDLEKDIRQIAKGKN